MADVTQLQPDPPSWHRLVLPAGVRQSGEVKRSARDWLVDVTMFVVAVAVGVLVLAQSWSQHPGASGALDVVGGTVACLALWQRRRYPLGVALLTFSLSAVCAFAAGAALVAGFNAAIRVAPRRLAPLAALGVAAGVVWALLFPDGSGVDWTSMLIGLLLTVIVFGWGLFVRAQRELLQSLRGETARLRDEQLRRSAQAREAERQRIAREMHDVLAHRISLLSLHAGALEFRPDAPPEEVAEAAAVIRASAHAALEDLRDVIGVLRDGEDGPAAPPQPTLAQLPALVQESRDAGTRVDLTTTLPQELTISDTLGRTVYRIVQEGLTNARKHAPAAAVEVRIVAGAAQLEVVVSSRPAVAVAVAAGPPPGAGTGLVGLTERVALAGGRLTHGRDVSGDFVLHATLPL
jgi:signal transduction histidine kinase